ncbi:hypothetical protein CV770_32605 [Bradyrhizobium sp. AC87j1]|nr:hypothetical protein CV770_32605 [Bradyrhizobium sp. AC87j1]
MRNCQLSTRRCSGHRERCPATPGACLLDHIPVLPRCYSPPWLSAHSGTFRGHKFRPTFAASRFTKFAALEGATGEFIATHSKRRRRVELEL